MITSRTFTHRAHVERDQAGEDEYDAPLPPDWETLHASLPCRYYIRRGTAGGGDTEIVDASKLTVAIRAKMLIPKGTDITEADRFKEIKDRGGSVIVSRPVGIEAILPRRDHLELLLKEVRSP